MRLDDGGSWVQIPSGTRVFSVFTCLLEFTQYQVVVISLLVSFKKSRIETFSLFLQKHEYRLEFGENRGPVLPRLLRNLLDFHKYFHLTIRLSSMDFLRVIKVATSSAIVHSREIESKSNWFGINLLITQSFYLNPLHRLFENTKKRPSFSYREVCSLCTKIY